MADLRVDWCSYEAASYACKNWHYSKCTPKFKQVWVGVWENSEFIGILSFGRSTTPYLGDAYGLGTTECAELTRVALRKHSAPVSKIMSFAIKLLKKQSSGLRLLVSLADPLQNHHGGIYQATNWIYVGRSSSCTQYYWRGKWRNDTSLHRHLQAYPNDKKRLKSRKIEGKYKYLMPLDREMKKKIEALAKPYPKKITRGLEEERQKPSVDGGATPTSTLHIKEVANG